MFGERLKELRLAEKLNKAALARLIDVSDVSVGYWESGQIQSVTSENLLKLADVFEITVSELLNDPMLQQHNETVARLAVEGYKTSQGEGKSVAQAQSASTKTSAVAAIAFALQAERGMDFLRCWIEEDYKAIRDEWPEAPREVFVAADPLLGKK